ncbi:hypothetical protein SAMN05421759_103147 [Roseivivax lentus]|uniref:Uncharacterized protein n=1 Tax=Roseivivax lentus TaxID=633194 RepID=A0A1N7LTS6_9RHOB|nr:hypothetical protein [Roseivivax lentus]SIS77174.1 hypothetical protein SAMN05421759_103147 [Roseivivax lentus]
MIAAGYFLLLSAALHVLGSVLSGFSPVGLFLLFPAVLYTGFFFGLRAALVWVAWLALVCMLGGMAGTALELAKASTVPDWILVGVLIADLGAAVMLVRALWPARAG